MLKMYTFVVICKTERKDLTKEKLNPFYLCNYTNIVV